MLYYLKLKPTILIYNTIFLIIPLLLSISYFIKIPIVLLNYLSLSQRKPKYECKKRKTGLYLSNTLFNINRDRILKIII